MLSVGLSAIISANESGDWGMAAAALLVLSEIEEELGKNPVEAGSTDSRAMWGARGSYRTPQPPGLGREGQ